MIGRAMRFLVLLMAYTAVATLLASAVGLGLMARSGRFEGERGRLIASLLRGEDIPRAASKRERPPEVDIEQPPFAKVEERRALVRRDVELRELALDQGLKSVRYEQAKLTDERNRFQLVRDGFDQNLTAVREGAVAAARTTVQQTLENLSAKQAKQQVLEMLGVNEIDHVVSLLAAMPIDKRTDILNEFKTDDEPQQLAEILREMRKGDPEVALVDKTQQQLDPSPEFKSQ